MATKAERFRYDVQRSGAARPKRTKKSGGATRRPSRGRKAGYELESKTANAQPSRKSTRKSENRAKQGSKLQRRQVRRASSPGARAAKAGAR
jgi:hypothetical protein